MAPDSRGGCEGAPTGKHSCRIADGARHEDTMRQSAEAWRECILRPDTLVEVGVVGTATNVQTTPVSSPIGVAPSGFHGLSHPEAQAASAGAAAEIEMLFVLSSRSTLQIEQVTPHCGNLWHQAYVIRDRDLTAAMVERATAAGARALVLTVNAPVLGLRRRSRDAALVDRAVLEVKAGKVNNLCVLEQSPCVTLADILWPQSVCGLPVFVKGVLRGDTASRCVDAGASAESVSNHGGRPLDGAVSMASALVEVMDGVEVYEDGGVGSGTDVLRAVAIGARAVFLRRPPLWGLAVNGRAGVAAVLTRYQTELEMAMRLTGRANLPGLGRDLIAGMS